MAKADLHVHSKYSNFPSEWALRRMGMQESYTEVEQVYKMAKARGMDYVTITDHDSIEGALILHELHPEDTFIGVEVTTYFPEDFCAIHLLVYDITQEQFNYIDQIRRDIYQLRDYLLEQDIAHSVAHGMYPVNGKLTMDVLEKLILLFDVFEGINGARNPQYNLTWHKTLSNLTSQDIDRLYKKHGIKPASNDAWIKGFTGGSDDHAGLLIAETYTISDVNTRDGFIRSLKNKTTHCSGLSNDFKSMVYVFGKIVHDFIKDSDKNSGRLFKSLNRVIYDYKSVNFSAWFRIQKLKHSSKPMDRALAKFANNLSADFVGKADQPHQYKVDCLFNAVAQLLDDYTKHHLKEIGASLDDGHLLKLFNTIGKMVSTSFIALPYLGTFKNLHLSNALIKDLRREYIGPYKQSERKVLWFSDTVADLNGVSVTLRNFATRAASKPYDMKLVTSLPENNIPDYMPENMINLPSISQYTPDFYSSYTMRFPSFLKAIDLILRENPTEIIISTPGPVGLVGLFVAKMLGIPVKAIYHSDFGMMMQYDVGGSIPKLLQRYENWFYKQVDEIKVPSNELIGRLKDRGLTNPMSIFKRGIDLEKFKPNPSARKLVLGNYGLPDVFTLLYTGRVSKDKSIDFLVDVYQDLKNKGEELNLIIVGDGPALDEIKARTENDANVILTGRLERDEIINLYAAADLLTFPSTIDTFGMSVLEAQACGLPALVTDVGGPQEIILDKVTGFVLPEHNLDIWSIHIKKMMHDANLDDFKEKSRQMVESRFSWETALHDIFESDQAQKSSLETSFKHNI